MNNIFSNGDLIIFASINIVALLGATYFISKMMKKKNHISNHLSPILSSFLMILFLVFIYCLISRYYLLSAITAMTQIIWLCAIALDRFYYTNKPNHYTNLPNITAEDIIDSLPGHIYWKNRDGLCLGCNQNQYIDIGGDNKYAYVGKTDYEFFPKEHADKIVLTDSQIVMTGKEQIIEEISTVANGDTAFYLSHKIPLKNKRNEVLGILGVSFDITKSKQEAENKVKTLENVISAIPANIYWMNNEGVYLGCNDSAANAIGLNSRDDIVGKRNIDILGNLIPEVLDPINNEVIKSGKTIIIEEPSVLRNGTKATYVSSKIPLRNDCGEITGMIGFSIDITARKKIEEELKIAKEEAEKVNTQKTEFIHNMEHDLRTPVGGIAQMSKILEEKETSPSTKVTLGMIARSSEQLLNILNSILSFRDVDSIHAHSILMKKFDIRKTIRGIIDIQIPTIELKKLQLTFSCSQEIPKIIISDETRIYRILLNLVSNATKFTHEGHIKITANIEKRIDDKNVILKIVVQDTGIGIPEDKQNIIYEKFVRCIPSSQGQYSGSGLGLSIVKKYIQELNGEIDLESQINEGSIFTLLLPVQLPLLVELETEHDKNNEEQVKSFPIRDDLKIKVLSVEDDVLAQAIATSLLQKYFPNAEIDLAASGKEAVNYSTNNNYDLIFVDLGLPDMNGCEVTKIIRSFKKNKMPIIALTAHDIAFVKNSCLKAGINDVITKPLNPEKIYNVVTTKWMNLKIEQSCESSGSSVNHSTEFKEAYDDTINKIIDLDFAAKVTGDANRAKELLSRFIKTLPEIKNTLTDAIEVSDFDLVSKLAHKLNGSASYCGTMKLKKVAHDLEYKARNNQKEEASMLFDKLKIAIDEIIENYA